MNIIYKGITISLLLFSTSLSKAMEPGSRVVRFEHDKQVVELFTYKTRAMFKDRVENNEGVLTVVEDEFSFGARQFFIGSELTTQDKVTHRNGLFEKVDNQTVYLIGPGDGFSINYNDQTFIILHNAFSNSSRFMESRIYRIGEQTDGVLYFDLLASLNGLAVMDAVKHRKKILLSGYCDGAEFAFELGFDSDNIPLTSSILNTSEDMRYNTSCDKILKRNWEMFGSK